MRTLGPNPLLAAIELREVLYSDTLKPSAKIEKAQALIVRITRDLCRLPQSREWNDEYYEGLAGRCKEFNTPDAIL
jgi:hypothetical protein